MRIVNAREKSLDNSNKAQKHPKTGDVSHEIKEDLKNRGKTLEVR